MSARPEGAAQASACGGVVFDLFGTLTDGRLERERARMIGRLAGVLGVPAADLVTSMRSSFTARATGRMGDVRETLAALCGELGARPDARALDRGVQLRLAIERDLAVPRADTVSVLRTLRQRGLGIAVVSDCGPETPAVWDDLPYAGLVDVTVFSCDVGHRKPHRELYRRACAGLGSPPGACLYVGDGGSRELSGARACGLRPVLLQVPGESHGPLLRYDPEPGWDGEAVASLTDVLALVPQAAGVAGTS